MPLQASLIAVFLNSTKLLGKTFTLLEVAYSFVGNKIDELILNRIYIFIQFYKTFCHQTIIVLFKQFKLIKIKEFIQISYSEANHQYHIRKNLNVTYLIAINYIATCLVKWIN